jgi:FkbM family methyltransferase
MNLEEYLAEPLPFEEELRRFFHESEALVIFDIGSCEAEDAIRLRRRFPNSKVHAFEPVPDNLARMRANIGRYGVAAVEVVPVALAATDGVATLHVSSGRPPHVPADDPWDYGNKSSSLLRPARTRQVFPWLKFEREISVETQRLDSYCQANAIEAIDIAYLDVQGSELSVLEGAGRMLDRVKMIWLEVEAVELYAGQPLRADVERFMRRHGFVRVRTTVGAVSGDQLYVNSKLLALSPLARVRQHLLSRLPARVRRS